MGCQKEGEEGRMTMGKEEQAVKVLAGLYRMRDDAKFLWGDRWQAKIGPAKEVLRGRMGETGEGVFEAIIPLMRRANEAGEPIAVLMFGAAAVEIAEEE